MTVWALYLGVVSALLAVAARSAESALAMRRLPLRFVWLCALGACLSIPMLLQLRPADRLERDAEMSAAITQTPASVARIVSRPPWHERVRVSAELDRTVGVVWLGSAGLALIVLFACLAGISAAPRRWPRERLDGSDVRIAPGSGPAVFGLVRPAIVIPRWLLGCPEEVRRLALLHEREHIAARDPLALAAGALLVAFMPWNPVAWWLLIRLRASVELDCDQRVLRRGVSRREYGDMLLGVAGRASSPVLATALVEPARLLERRIMHMTRCESRRPLTMVTLGALAGIALLGACVLDSPAGIEEAERIPTGESAPSASVDSEVERKARITAVLSSKGEAPEAQSTDTVVFQTQLKERADLEAFRREVTEKMAGGLELKSIEIMRPKLEADTLVVLERWKRPADEPGRSGAGRIHWQGSTDGMSKSLPLKLRSGSSPLIRLDGREISEAEMKGISPDRIESIEVVKGPAARKIVGERAEHGLIDIQTKKNR